MITTVDYEKIPLLADTVLRGDYRESSVKPASPSVEGLLALARAAFSGLVDSLICIRKLHRQAGSSC